MSDARDVAEELSNLPWIDCWQCGGEGDVSSCLEEWACIDPEEGCEDCRRRCDVCNGSGGWHGDDDVE